MGKSEIWTYARNVKNKYLGIDSYSIRGFNHKSKLTTELLPLYLGKKLRVNFTNVLSVAFTLKDLKSAKKTLMTWLYFCTFGIFKHKRCA